MLDGHCRLPPAAGAGGDAEEDECWGRERDREGELGELEELGEREATQAHDAEGPVRLHRLLGHLPMLLHPAPRDVLVIGLGGGVTPGAVATHPQARVDVVELVPAVVEGARRFGHVNGDVVDSPAGRSTVRLRVDDGRNYYAARGPRGAALRRGHGGHHPAPPRRRGQPLLAGVLPPDGVGAA